MTTYDPIRLLLVAALLAGACSGRGSEPTGRFEILTAETIEAEDGALVETAAGPVVYYRRSTSVCRRVVDRGTENCVDDERLGERRIASRLASESKLIVLRIPVRPTDVPHAEAHLLIDFDTGAIAVLDAEHGAPSALSPAGDRLLWYDWPNGVMTVSRPDGSAARSLRSTIMAFGGRWSDHDRVWLHSGPRLSAHDVDADREEGTVAAGAPAGLSLMHVNRGAGVGLAWDLLTAEMEFVNSIWLVSPETGLSLALPTPADGFPLALGVAPDASYTVIIWERDSESVELWVSATDGRSGIAMPARRVHTFDRTEPSEAPVWDMRPWPMPQRIAIDQDGKLTWFTNSAVLTANLGAVPGLE